jgi:hypothetical protein
MIETIKEHLKIRKKPQIFTFTKDKVVYEGHKYMGELPGVYWLMDKDEVVYIGRSKEIMVRLTNHSRSKYIWDTCKFVIVDNELTRNNLEFALIRINHTRYNNRNSVKVPNNFLSLYKNSINKYKRIIKDIDSFIETEPIQGYKGVLKDVVDSKPVYERLIKLDYTKWFEEYCKKLDGKRHMLV